VRWVTAGVEAVAVVGEAGSGDAVVTGMTVGRDAAELDQLLDRREEAVDGRVGNRGEADTSHAAASLLNCDQHRCLLGGSAPVFARRDAADVGLVDLDLAGQRSRPGRTIARRSLCSSAQEVS
jgi:hypothetical protein